MNSRPGSPPSDGPPANGNAGGGPPSQSDPPQTDPPQVNPSQANPPQVSPMVGESPDRSAAERIIDRFGGIRPMATKLRVPVTTVQGWKKRGAIPTLRHGDLLAAAGRHGIVIDPADLEASTPDEERTPNEERAPGLATAPEAIPLPPPAGSEPPEPAQPPDPEPEPAAHPATAMPARDTQSRGGAGARNAAVVFALVALIGAGVAATAPLWSPYFSPAQDQATTDMPARIARLEQQAGHPGVTTADLQSLESRIAALETRPVPQPDPDLPARVAALEKGLGDLDHKLAALDQRLSAGLQSQSGHLSQDLATVDSRVAHLDQTIAAREAANAATEAVVLAGGQLRAALEGDQPFQAELAAVRDQGAQALSPDLTRALDAIADHAASGIPTRTALTGRFGTVASDAVRAARGGGDAGDWGAQALAQMQSLVTVRRGGADASGAAADAVVARTDARLRQGDLAGALDQIGQLTGPAAAAAADWVRDARARLAADHAATLLAGEALARLRQDAASPAKVNP